MRILFLSRWFPVPANNGSKLRIYNLLRGLAKQHEITLLSFADQPKVDLSSSALRAICSDIQVVPYKPFEPLKLEAVLNLFSRYPRSVVSTFSHPMRAQIEKNLRTRKFDLIIASQIDMMIYSAYFDRVPALLEELELGTSFQHWKQACNPWYRLRHYMTWIKQKRYLAEQMPRFRACTVVSEQERHLLSHTLSTYSAVQVVPNGIDLASYQNVARNVRSSSLIFTGSFHYRANYDAMCWFVSQVYPMIRSQIPNVHLTITGDHANLPLPSKEGITLTGFVDDVRPLIASSCASLAPIWQGGGTRLKILEAMALRTPVVATSKGAEGLDARHNEHLLIADSPEDLANETLRLLREPSLRERLAENAYQLVRDRYDWKVILPQFLSLVERIIKD